MSDVALRITTIELGIDLGSPGVAVPLPLLPSPPEHGTPREYW